MTEQYVLADAEHGAERARLDLLEAAHDPITQRRLRAVGVAPGWRCLEVGAGGGSIVRWLADQVGAAGAVVAVDINTRFLVDLPPNVEVREHDIRRDDFEPEAFDLVHCRSVLMHLPDKHQALVRMTAALRVGGWLCAEEGDWGLLTLGGHPDAAWANELRDRMLTAAQSVTPLDLHAGRALPGLLAQLGFEDIDGYGVSMIARQGEPSFDRHRMDMGHVRGGALALNSATEAELDRFESILADPRAVLLGGTSVGVWGRKPSGGE
jgi:SAM-dependent methyltransferase